MTLGLVGKKRGMTRVFTETGNSYPVTVVSIEPNIITQVKTNETDGYSSVQVTTGSKKEKHLKRSEAGKFKKVSVEPGEGLWEFSVSKEEIGELIESVEKNSNKIHEAAEAANAKEFIDALPKGFDTVIGEKGVRLSGGQRQRLAIARALLKDPPILILDEATSSLDTESEKNVQEAIDNLMKDRTVLVIAHRLSTIINADMIIVLDDGKIIESGTHNELLEKDGAYKNLYDIQFNN